MPMGTKVTTPEFRVSFPAVFEARAFEAGAEAKYGLSMVFAPDADLSALERIVEEALQAKWGAKRPGGLKLPIRPNSDKAGMEGYPTGGHFASATTKQPPGLVDARRQRILSREDFYPGCFARATVTAYAYDNKGKGVAFGLHNLQKTRDGEHIDGRASAEDDFSDVDAGEKDFLG